VGRAEPSFLVLTLLYFTYTRAYDTLYMLNKEWEILNPKHHGLCPRALICVNNLVFAYAYVTIVLCNESPVGVRIFKV